MEEVKVEVEVTPKETEEEPTQPTTEPTTIIVKETTLEEERNQATEMALLYSKVQSLEMELSKSLGQIRERIEEGEVKLLIQVENMITNLQATVNEDLTENENNEQENAPEIPVIPQPVEQQEEPKNEKKSRSFLSRLL